MQININNLPLELRELRQWVNWKRIVRDGDPKPTKVPFQPCGRIKAATNNPDTWCLFEEAIAGLANNDGIGFVFSSSDPYFGLDLDHVRDPQTNSLLPWSDDQRKCEHWTSTIPDPDQLVDVLSSSCYCEISPSGTGVHIIGRGSIARGRKLGDLEIYKLGRFFTVTGNPLSTSPAPSPFPDCSSLLSALLAVFDNKPKPKKQPRKSHPHHNQNGRPLTLPTVDQIIAKARGAANAAAFDRLFTGDTSGYTSHSEADAALCGILSFWCCADSSLLDSTFRQSKLYRDKWDEQHSSDGRTYGEMTCDNAIAGCNEFYDWSAPGKPAPKSYSLGPVTFTIKSSDNTNKKTTVTLELSLDGKPIDVITFTTATSNRRDAVKLIKQKCFYGDDPTTPQQIDNLLGTILVDASRPKEQAKADERPPEAKDVHEILEEIIPPMVQLAYRTDGGKAYSRVLGDEMSRAEFSCRCLSKEVISIAAKAFDAPRDKDEQVLRSKLIPMVKQELEVLWGHLLGQLPTIDGAELTDDDRSVADFRQLIIDLWTRPCAMGIHSQRTGQGGQAVQLATRSSLASKVRRMKHENTLDFSDKWTSIHETYSAFYREHFRLEGDTKGEVMAYLAMKFELFSQVGLKPKGFTKRTFKATAEKYQTIDTSGEIPDRMSNGGKLIVLSRLMIDRILSAPIESGDNRKPVEHRTEKPAPSPDVESSYPENSF